MIFRILDLIDFYSIKGLNFHKNIAKFNVKHLIKKVIKIDEKKAESKNIQLTADLDKIGSDE